MERLTARNKNGRAIALCCVEKCEHECECKAKGIDECEGIIKLVYRLAEIENILGDDYDLSRLQELVEADREGRCVVLPCGVGDSVFHITTCNGFRKILDGTMYGANGEHGTATGYYCPCELAENCPFQLEEDGSFDCEKHKNTAAIYEDVATEIVVNDMESFVKLDYSGCVNFGDFGKTVFLTREAANAALKERKKK